MIFCCSHASYKNNPPLNKKVLKLKYFLLKSVVFRHSLVFRLDQKAIKLKKVNAELTS